MRENKGKHSVRELLELTKDLEFFRYYPSAASLSRVDSLNCRIVPNDLSKIRSIRTELRNRLIKKYSQCLVDFTSVQEGGYIGVELSNGEEQINMKDYHFELGHQIEIELLELGKELGFTLRLNENLEEWAFMPEKWK